MYMTVVSMETLSDLATSDHLSLSTSLSMDQLPLLLLDDPKSSLIEVWLRNPPRLKIDFLGLPNSSAVDVLAVCKSGLPNLAWYQT